jgi:hypothetical protein
LIPRLMADDGAQNQLAEDEPRVRMAWLSHDQLELLIAVGLGVAAVLTAFTVYLVKVADDNAEKAFNVALTRVTEETGAALDAAEARSADETFFLDYETTRVNPHSEAGAHALLEDVASPQLQQQIKWWEGQRGTPGAVYTPFTEENPFYVDYNGNKVEEKNAEAKAEFHDAEAYHEESRRLILAGIILATALFLFGVAGVIRERQTKLVLTSMAYIGVIGSVIAVIAA